MDRKYISIYLILIFAAVFCSGPALPKTVWATDVEYLAFDLNTIEKELKKLLTDWGETAFRIDNLLIRHVSYFLKFYTVQEVERSNEVIRRSEKYIYYIKNVFGNYKIHEDIAFALPFVESGFNASAQSKAGALGMFQFVGSTARRYGLKVDGNRDERKDFKKAAVACAKYLRDNRRVFASMVLSLGSYHHGTQMVMNALLTYGDEPERRFGPIFQNKILGPYSREYIPQCLAAALIYRYLKQHNLVVLPVPAFESQTLGSKMPVTSLKKKIPRLYQMNPDLQQAKSTYAYASTSGYVLLTKLEYPTPPEIKKPLPGWALNPALAPSGDTKVRGLPKTIQYVFQRHNELAVIAAIFGTGVKPLKFSNRYLMKRTAHAGDIIEVKGMSPTTQSLTVKTLKNETIKTFCQRAVQSIRSAGTDSSWEMGADVSPERIYYWNHDLLGYIEMDTPLQENLPLKIYSDYLWHKKVNE